MARKKHTPTKSKSTATRKLNTLKVADGKEQDIKKIKELEELIGLPHTHAFGTNNAKVLEGNMDKMNVSDLQAFAVKIGLFPSGSRLQLKNKILKEFYSTEGAGAGIDIGFQKPVVDPDSPQGRNLIELMREGL